MYQFSNDGEILQSTNYFDSVTAKRGQYYLTWNNGVGRLLVPQSAQDEFLREIRKTKKVEIEYVDGGLRLFFIDNNPNYPYMLQLAKEQTDRYDRTKGKTKIAVYVELGLKHEFKAEIL